MKSVYEGRYWHAKVIYSNRWGNRVEWTTGGSNRVITWREEKAQNAILKLEKGIDPDTVKSKDPDTVKSKDP